MTFPDDYLSISHWGLFPSLPKPTIFSPREMPAKIQRLADRLSEFDKPGSTQFAHLFDQKTGEVL